MRIIRFISLVIALFFAVAICFKLLQLSDFYWYFTATNLEVFSSRIAIVIESIIVIWLLSNWKSNIALNACGLLFVLFSYLNIYFLFTDQSCNCFGGFSPKPHVMLILDSVFAFVSFNTSFLCAASSESRVSKSKPTIFLFGLVVFSVFCYARFNSTLPSTNRDIGILGDVRLLQPEEWVGGRLEIIDFIELDDDAEPELILLVSGNCKKCATAIDKYSQDFLLKDKCVVSINDWDGLPPPACTKGVLSKDFQWVCKTPLIIQTENEIVVSVSDY